MGTTKKNSRKKVRFSKGFFLFEKLKKNYKNRNKKTFFFENVIFLSKKTEIRILKNRNLKNILSACI